MLAESLDVGQKFPVIDMQTALIVSHKHPSVSNDLANCQLRSFVDNSYFFSVSDDSPFRVEMVRCAGLVEILIGKIILREVPRHAFLLMEGEHIVPCNPNRQQLCGEGVILPPIIPEQLQLEGLEQCQNSIDLQKVKRRLQFCDLLQGGLRFLNADLIDL